MSNELRISKAKFIEFIEQQIINRLGYLPEERHYFIQTDVRAQPLDIIVDYNPQYSETEE